MKVLGSHGNQYTGMSQVFFITAQVSGGFKVFFWIFTPNHGVSWSNLTTSNGLVKNHPTRNAPDSFEKDVSFQVYLPKFKEKRIESTEVCQTWAFSEWKTSLVFFFLRLAQETAEVRSWPRIILRTSSTPKIFRTFFLVAGEAEVEYLMHQPSRNQLDPGWRNVYLFYLGQMWKYYRLYGLNPTDLVLGFNHPKQWSF